MIPELKKQIESRIQDMQDDPMFMEDDDYPDRDTLERYALSDIIEAGPDCYGNFRLGILPTFSGPNAAKMQAKQSAWLEQHHKDHAAWKRIYRSAKREAEKRKIV